MSFGRTLGFLRRKSCNERIVSGLMPVSHFGNRHSTETRHKHKSPPEENYPKNCACPCRCVNCYCLAGGSVGAAVVDAAGKGAPLPAVSGPSPSLLSDTASIFPVGAMP